MKMKEKNIPELYNVFLTAGRNKKAWSLVNGMFTRPQALYDVFLSYFLRFGVQSMMIVSACFMTVKLPFVEEKAFSKASLCHF